MYPPLRRICTPQDVVFCLVVIIVAIFVITIVVVVSLPLCINAIWFSRRFCFLLQLLKMIIEYCCVEAFTSCYISDLVIVVSFPVVVAVAVFSLLLFFYYCYCSRIRWLIIDYNEPISSCTSFPLVEYSLYRWLLLLCIGVIVIVLVRNHLLLLLLINIIHCFVGGFLRCGHG